MRLTLFDKVMNNISREHTVRFKIPENAHYYIGLTVHSCEDYLRMDGKRTRLLHSLLVISI